MSEEKTIKLIKVAKELNIGISTIVDFLGKKGVVVEGKPNTNLDATAYKLLLQEFQTDKDLKEEAKQIAIGKVRKEDAEASSIEGTADVVHDTVEEEAIIIKDVTLSDISSAIVPPAPVGEPSSLPGIKVVGKIDLAQSKKKPAAKQKEVEPPAATKPKEKQKEKEKEKKAPIQEQEPVEEKKTEPVVAVKEEVVETAPTTAPSVETTEQTIESVETPTIAIEPDKSEIIRARADKLVGPNVVGRIELPIDSGRKKAQPVASSSGSVGGDAKKKRKRKEKPKGAPNTNTTPHGNNNNNNNSNTNGGKPRFERQNPRFAKPGQGRTTNEVKAEPSDKEIQDQIKATLAQLSGAGKQGKFAQRSRLRRQKRDDIAQSAEDAAMEQELQAKVLKVTEFVTANELANMMDVSVTQIISTCMSLGMFVSINQRLSAEILSLVAEEFGYEVEFIKPDDQNVVEEEDDKEENLIPRPPIITVMGHVDHGKTSLLDFVRSANVIAGEAGGITQHIGAYEVTLADGRQITFLDTPGHEAFTAMRARGAQATDIAVIVIAADDCVMPQTTEAINHAQAAGVPIVFAFNKMDKDGANPEKIREQLANMNLLVEEWGGKYQTQEISAKKGLNIDLLLEKVLLEAEMLNLKANPNKRAVGTVIDAKMEKGKGMVTTLLVQSGTLRVGDPLLAGCTCGRVKAMHNERGQKVEFAGPSTPVQVLGLNDAPSAGDRFNVMESEVEAREMATKRAQLQREQGMRAKKHITLDEIGRRLAIGNFKELNIIVKGDVDGSVEALSDALLKLSTDEVQINIIAKSVGQISESDVLLATASDAIIVGFQVRPSASARKLAETEQIDLRLYSVIYDAINEVKQAMEGMLEPTYEEKVVANVEIREVFKITKVGTIAGCMVLDGKVTRNSKIRLVRDGVVLHSGELGSLKRFKDDVKEVASGYECGLNVANYNDIQIGDIIEAYENIEIKRTL